MPNAAGLVPADTIYTLFGVRFVMDTSVPEGDVVATPGVVASPLWRISPESFAALKAKSNGMQQSIVQIIKQRGGEGATVVAGVVTQNTRRGPAAPKARHSNLDDLSGRAKALIVQIGTLLDAGPIPDGQMAEISQTYAGLQAEYDRVLEQLAEVQEHVSMARGLVIEFATAP